MDTISANNMETNERRLSVDRPAFRVWVDPSGDREIMLDTIRSVFVLNELVGSFHDLVSDTIQFLLSDLGDLASTVVCCGMNVGA